MFNSVTGTLRLSVRWKLEEAASPGGPLEIQVIVNADTGALRQVSTTACATMIIFHSDFYVL